MRRVAGADASATETFMLRKYANAHGVTLNRNSRCYAGWVVTSDELCGRPVVAAFDPTRKYPCYGSIVTSTTNETTKTLFDVAGCYGHGVGTTTVTDSASGCEVSAGDRTIGGQEGEGGYGGSGIVSCDSHIGTEGQGGR